MMEGVRNNPVLRHKLFQIDYLTTKATRRLSRCCITKR
jgi:tRNA (uracil-5-)-methyltransferase